MRKNEGMLEILPDVISNVRMKIHTVQKQEKMEIVIIIKQIRLLVSVYDKNYIL